MHLIENKGVKSECMKFGENSRQMPSVSTICDEYCSFHLLVVGVKLIYILASIRQPLVVCHLIFSIKI